MARLRAAARTPVGTDADHTAPRGVIERRSAWGCVPLARALTDEEFRKIDEADGRVIVYAFLDFNDAFGCKIRRKVCFLFNGAAARGGNPEVCGGDY